MFYDVLQLNFLSFLLCSSVLVRGKYNRIIKFASMSQWLETPIEFLKGVGPQRAELLRKELGVFTFEDLLQHFPFRYVDRTSFQKVKDIHMADGFVQLKGQIVSIREVA